MAFFVLADCASARQAADRLAAWLHAHVDEGGEPVQVHRLDLEAGPPLTRAKAVIGIGWHAREKLRRIIHETGREVDAILEACGCARHHLMGLGRTGPYAARWSLAPPSPEREWVDRLAAREGARLILPPHEAPPAGVEAVRLDAAWTRAADQEEQVRGALRTALPGLVRAPQNERPPAV